MGMGSVLKKEVRIISNGAGIFPWGSRERTTVRAQTPAPASVLICE